MHGLLDPAAYKENLEAADSAPRYVKNVVWMLRQFLDFAKVATVPGIHVADAERFCASVRAKRSAKTRDHHTSALRSFGRWVVRSRRWGSNPFDGLPVKTAKDKNRVFKRTSFRFEEAERLVEAVWARHEAELPLRGTPTHDGYEDAVRDRQVLYWFALTTAFRANECASIRWEDLRLDDPKPSVRLAGKFTKNGQDANVPLQAFVVEAMKTMRSRRSATQMRNDKGPVQETEVRLGLKAFLCDYFSAVAGCDGKLGKSISPIKCSVPEAKGLKVRFGYPGCGKSGGLRLAVLAFCDHRLVKIAGAWIRREDPDDGDFAVAFDAS